VDHTQKRGKNRMIIKKFCNKCRKKKELEKKGRGYFCVDCGNKIYISKEEREK